MGKYIVTVAISGSASCEVEAESKAEAIEKSRECDWEIESWDRNTELNRGGFIDVEET